MKSVRRCYRSCHAQLDGTSTTISGTANSGGASPSPYNASRSSSDGTQAQTTQTATVVTGNSVISANGSGMTIAYGTSLNLHDGQAYLGGGKANPLSPSGNIMFGYLLFPGDNPTLETNNFLNGGSVPMGGCMFGVCMGLNHSIGGQTSVEFGLGTPGISTGVTVSKPVGGAHW